MCIFQCIRVYNKYMQSFKFTYTEKGKVQRRGTTITDNLEFEKIDFLALDKIYYNVHFSMC